MTLVKICGLTRPQDIEAVNALMPDMAGFVFYGPSRRCVTRETAQELGSMLAPSIVKVGVFVDEDPLVIARFSSMEWRTARTSTGSDVSSTHR